MKEGINLTRGFVTSLTLAGVLVLAPLANAQQISSSKE